MHADVGRCPLHRQWAVRNPGIHARLRSDEEAEKFLEQDLSDLDFSQFKPVRFEFEKKEARLSMRLPGSMLRAVKERAKRRGIPYQRFVREALEQSLNASR